MWVQGQGSVVFEYEHVPDVDGDLVVGLVCDLSKYSKYSTISAISAPIHLTCTSVHLSSILGTVLSSNQQLSSTSPPQPKCHGQTAIRVEDLHLLSLHPSDKNVQCVQQVSFPHVHVSDVHGAHVLVSHVSSRSFQAIRSKSPVSVIWYS